MKSEDKTTSFKTSGTVLVTDTMYARELALAGVGIAYLFEPLVRTEIRKGLLKQLMPQTAIEADGLFFYHPRRASLSPKLRAFIDAARYR